MSQSDPTTSPAPARIGQLRAALHGHGALVLGAVIVALLAGLAEAAMIGIIALGASALVDGLHTVHVVLGGVHLAISFTLLVDAGFVAAGVRLLVQFPIAAVPARMATGVQASMRRRLFDAFTRASWAEQATDAEGQLQELMTTQVGAAANAAAGFTSLVTAVITFLILIITAVALNALVALVAVAAVSCLFALMRPLNSVFPRQSRVLSQVSMDFATGVGQSSQLAEEVHAFGVAEAQRNVMDESIALNRRLAYRYSLITRLIPSIYQSCVYLLVIGALAALGSIHASHVASLGAAVLLLYRAGSYGQGIQSSYTGLLGVMPYVDRVQQATQRYAASAPASGRDRQHEVRTLTTRHLGYSYKVGEAALSDVSFTAVAGETVGIIGPSGGGKSTLVQLLMRLRAPDAGEYLVNEVPVERFAGSDWHALFAFVPQDPRLVHASVADNIRFLRDLDDEAVERAARLARIHDEIVSWPRGYETIVGPRADAVSGGQQQRICIARALAGRPSVLILDEPTSALDSASERLIQESLSSLKESMTLFIVAHRMSTLDVCDRIMVIANGRLEALDTPENLRIDNSYFRSALSVATSGATEVTGAVRR
jgi:ABC-type multidrug transport system fused ATPase/permease subunit